MGAISKLGKLLWAWEATLGSYSEPAFLEMGATSGLGKLLCAWEATRNWHVWKWELYLGLGVRTEARGMGSKCLLCPRAAGLRVIVGQGEEKDGNTNASC